MTIYSSIRHSLYAVILMLIPSILAAQAVKHDRLLSFESAEIPPFITSINSELSISGKHYKDGNQSLRWKFQPSATLTLKKDLHFEKKDSTGTDKYQSVFVVWIYNKEPIDQALQFSFRKNGKSCTSFPFHLNFRGWRAAWVSYERDMQGTPEEGMDELCIIAPKATGEIFIDHLLTAAKMDHRYQTPDLQVPFVNKETNNHWLFALKYSKLSSDLPLEATVSNTQKSEMKIIENRLRELICPPDEVTPQTIASLRKAYESYHITFRDHEVSGLPIFYARAVEAYERIVPNWKSSLTDTGNMTAGTFFNLMNRIAVAYNNTTVPEDKAELREMFLAMYAHITDQGFAYGSCLGNLTHYGYSFRPFFTAYFLMKEVLREAGKQEEAEKAMHWYSTVNDVYNKPTTAGIDIDFFNTLSTGRIASILFMEDTPTKVQYLKSFSRWIDNGCLPAQGLNDAFKKDGSAYHHCNNYPAYATGGLTGATNMIYLLSHTGFAISEPAHQTVKEVLLTMRFYCNKRSFPLSMSGRHPNGKGELVPNHYAIMALAGSPDRKEDIDTNMASAYLRLVQAPYKGNKQELRLKKLLSDKGFIPEPEPYGNKAMGYACVSVQRRDNWSAVARGHSRYLWAAEHYRGANLYGRYLAHGSLQIMTAPTGEEVSSTSGGWQEEGFDWGRIPGTTAIHLPIDQLEANILNVDLFSGYEEMLYSDEAFAGGISQEQRNGAFGMKLHEHDKYNGSLRARKSFHFFDGVIVCLGSDIENTNDKFNTETTLFQLAVKNAAEHSYWKDYQGNGKYWIDPIGTGYYTPTTVKFEKNFPQESCKQNTGEKTEGDWVSLTIDHGKAPKGASYEYAILPKTDATVMKSFVKKPSYKVLQKDRNAHIVRDLKSNTTSYVLFETPNASLPKSLIQRVDTSCLIMLREDKQETVLTVCQPDLALYRGPSDDIYDGQGKRIERSIYSRPWIGNPSQPIPVCIELKGQWGINNVPFCKVLSSDAQKTVLQFTCTDAASLEVKLHKR
ncbi:chondroitinase family polysaccharide lyase [Bacteroides sp.]